MSEKQVVLKVENLCKEFMIKKGMLFQKDVGRVRAVNNISFTVHTGETMGIIGESGCGKTTLTRMIIGLESITSGQILLNGNQVDKHMSLEQRRNVQMVFQDPYSSLDPRMSVRKILEEPLRIYESLGKTEKEKIVLPVLEQVGLSKETLKRYPHEFSGGQRQRIGIARALVAKPKLLLCDEPVSALDVSIQAQILNLLKDLQKTNQMTYLFVSHDMSVIRHISDRILVMYMGQAVELADKKSLFEKPAHPYTRALMSAVPVPDPNRQNQCQVLGGEIPSISDVSQGCPFYKRCKWAMGKCGTEKPEFIKINEGHFTACHLYDKEKR